MNFNFNKEKKSDDISDISRNLMDCLEDIESNEIMKTQNHKNICSQSVFS